MRQIVGLLGTPIDILNMQEALERLEQFIEQKRFHQVATANTDFLINALDDKELSTILREADLVVPDGMPLIWAARLMRSPLPERVTGADLVPALAELAAQKGYRIFMLGARPEVAQRARERFEEDYPGIQIVGCLSPEARSLVEMDSESILKEIHAAKPDILFVAFGNPKQEKWIHLHREQLKAVSICIGVGGTFDFIAGKTIRAPLWLQRTGLEWLFRLLQEPRRLWKRYYRDITQFSRYLINQWRAISWGHSKGSGEVFYAISGDSTLVSVVGNFSGGVLPRFKEIAEESFNSHRHLLLDFQKVTGFDGQALGTLLNLPKRAAFRDCDVRLVAATPRIMRALTQSQIEDGGYQIAPTIAQAFTNVRTVGLTFEVRRLQGWAIIQLRGASERKTVRKLEMKCHSLLEERCGVELDLSDVSYVDTILLALLTELAESHAGQFRIRAGEALLERLSREKMQNRLPLFDDSIVTNSMALPAIVAQIELAPVTTAVSASEDIYEV